MRKLFVIICVMVSLSLSAKPFTVVIDAGHGGKDAGAVGRTMKIQEKNLNLDVSLRLASKIRTAYPEVNVVLTRDKDEFITLQGRADIVNKNDADLFICIHTNAAESRAAHGAETFILGTEKMEQNLDVAMRENAVMKMEADYQTKYQGFDPNSIDSYIMFELMQNQYMDQSLKFASLVQNQFANTLKRDDRGVRQAAFWVLLKSACPSVLVEIGFVSNQDEEKYLASDKGKREITEAIFTAFRSYYDKGNKNGTSEEVKDENPEKTQEQPEEEKMPTLARPKAEVSEIVVPQKVGGVEAEQPTLKEPEKNMDIKQVAMEHHPSWRVQIFVATRVLSPKDRELVGLEGYSYREVKGLYKYMVGDFATKEEAAELQKKMRTRFPDCFVVKID